MIRNRNGEFQNRLATKTIDEAFKAEIRAGLNCSTFEAEAITEVVHRFYLPFLSGKQEIRPGQMLVMAISAKEPPGKPLGSCQSIPVTLTVHAGAEDDELRLREGIPALRRRQILRMAQEAVDQGALLTVEDLAYKILNVGVRTVVRDLAVLRRSGQIVPLRGQQKDIGRGLTHRIQAIELYLQRKTYTQITRAIHHSLDAIRNYLVTFAQVALLTEEGRSATEIAFLVQISKALVQEYQALYHRALTIPSYRERLGEILTMGRGAQRRAKQPSGKGGRR